MDCQKSASSRAVRALAVLSLFVAALFLISCQPSLYRIQPLKKEASPVAGKALDLGELKIVASAVLTDEEAFARFDSNLLLAGILAVELEITNTEKLARRLRVELADARGQRFRPLKAEAVLKRMMSYEGVRLYALEARKNTLASLEEQALGNRLLVAENGKLRGTLFFDLKGDIAAFSGLVLRVEADGKAASLQLN